MLDSLAVESSRLFAGAWSRFCRQTKRGEVHASEHLVCTWANGLSPILNMAFLQGSIDTEGALREHAKAAISFAEPRKVPWLFTVCLDELDPSIRTELGRILGELGLVPAMTTTGMVADALLPPRRPAPVELAYRSIQEEAVRPELARINAAAYHESEELFLAPLREGVISSEADHGIVGYAWGAAVACSNTTPMDDVLYVSWVATLPEKTRRGYAEAVMRRSIEDAMKTSGLVRTALHATPAGYPVYLAMGYKPVAAFESFMIAPQQ